MILLVEREQRGQTDGWARGRSDVVELVGRGLKDDGSGGGGGGGLGGREGEETSWAGGSESIDGSLSELDGCCDREGAGLLG